MGDIVPNFDVEINWNGNARFSKLCDTENNLVYFFFFFRFVGKFQENFVLISFIDLVYLLVCNLCGPKISSQCVTHHIVQTQCRRCVNTEWKPYAYPFQIGKRSKATEITDPLENSHLLQGINQWKSISRLQFMRAECLPRWIADIRNGLNANNSRCVIRWTSVQPMTNCLR